MRKCRRCSQTEEKQCKKTGQMFTSPFGFCNDCHAKFVPLLKELKQWFIACANPVNKKVKMELKFSQ